MPVDLFLVRHGESEGNVALNAAKNHDLSLMTEAFRSRSAADYRLSVEGRRQAERAGEWIRDWMSHSGVAAFDRFYCSPFARTRETAALLRVPGATWQLEPLLRERDFGLWEGKARPVTNEVFAASTALKERNKFLWRPEGGESTPDLDMRARDVLATLARELPGRRVLCVTHEDVMWAFRFRLEKMTIEDWLETQRDDRHDIVNCAILHYTRTASDDRTETADKFARVRLVDPANPAAAEWHRIERPRFTDDELLDQLSKITPLRELDQAQQAERR